MYKVAWIARFPQGMPKEDARKHWVEVHAPMCIKTPGLARYVQNHVAGPLPLESGVAEEETLFDGYSCGWWEDEDAFRASMATREWLALAEDGDNIFDMSWLEGMSAEVQTHTMIEGPSSPYKVVWILRFKEGLDRAEASAYWRNTHGPIFKSLDIDRYVQNHAVGPVGGGGEVGSAPLRRLLGVLVQGRGAVPACGGITYVGGSRRRRRQPVRQDPEVGVGRSAQRARGQARRGKVCERVMTTNRSLHGGSSSCRLTTSHSPRSRRDQTRREDRHLKFYELRDNLAISTCRSQGRDVRSQLRARRICRPSCRSSFDTLSTPRGR